MFDVQAKAGTPLVNSVSAANTAAATSAWVAVPVTWDGDVEIVALIGAVTGSVILTFQTADDNSGTGAVSITPDEGALTSVSASNAVQKATFPRTTFSKYVKVTGTIVTGPVLIGIAMFGRNKSV